MLLPRNHHHLHLSTCLSGGGGGKAAYAVELSTSSSSSAASTLSTSSSPCSVAATRKPRTPRKRPNQTYNEAAALLSASYPNLFDSPKCHAGTGIPFLLLRRCGEDDHLLFSPPPPTRCLLPRSDYSSSDCLDFAAAAATDPDSDFDAESLLDDDSSADAGRGIDTIMGDLAAANDDEEEDDSPPRPLGLGFAAALRRDFFRGEAANWWCFPAVDMLELSPRLNRAPPPPPPPPAKQKKMKKTKAAKVETAAEEGIGAGVGLSLNLNYDAVLRAWSGKGSAFSDEGLAGGTLNDDDVAVGPTLTSPRKSSKSKKMKSILKLK